ncbi:DNA polymerase III subunit chi [Legionella israelensis]|uniref:DNA polymerase III subunit chi n=1 Tax=Legionella israelensis TaxID=454 RepID=A0A0W0WN73_9GAMM|nr:DNA polymerase III subunit chi [Legionella israelensis]KTD33778.1 DNA polymerase III subunit chi [Legionella israelensis]QBS09271.1 DNA polymerase III subunit chi [Legionella israelensis]QDP71877.1 DNA polymerase III subunit chi [Legionella israelensis]SCY31836.1 DNA polymerase III, chi subunit [Legionella israelensis DSM 19235]STX59019.1 DNA polymerase III subunit chi [Legionella israelensis]
MRVDFYLLNQHQPDHRWLVACRLLEKAYFKGRQVFVFCSSQQEAEKLDERLWTYREDSFVPHNLQGEGPEPPPPIQIGHAGEPRGFNDILMNMSGSMPSFHSRFQRIIEIVANDDTSKECSRQLYREYRALNFELHVHHLDW